MANHCYNYASGTGPKEELIRLQSIVNLLKNPEFPGNNTVWCWAGVFPLFFPQPVGEQEESEDSEEPKYPDPYETWGSKWFEANFEFDLENNSIIISGDSAWSPVTFFMEKLSKEYKLELSGSYEEGGMDFAGEYSTSPEGLFNHNETTYRQYQADNYPESYWDELIMCVEDGQYDSIEAVFEELNSVEWKPTEEEKGEIEKAFAKYLESNES